MRRLRYVPAVCVLALAAPLLAAPPVDVPAEVKGDVGAFVALRATTAGKVVKFVPLDPGLNVFPADLLSDKKATVVSASKPGKYRVLAYSSVKDDPTEPAVVTVVIGAAPAPPGPGPGPQPDPKPVDPPAPDALKTFRVILVAESGATLTAAQYAVLYAKQVGDWLDANTTDTEGPGWRRRDPDAAATGDKAAFNALWAATKPQAKHCTAIVERNGRTQVIPFAATPEAMIDTLTKLREGK